MAKPQPQTTMNFNIQLIENSRGFEYYRNFDLNQEQKMYGCIEFRYLWKGNENVVKENEFKKIIKTNRDENRVGGRVCIHKYRE